MNPYKTNFTLFHKLGTWLVSLITRNTNNNLNNAHINNQPSHMQQKYIFKHIKGNMVIPHQIFTSNRNTYNHTTNIMLIESRKT